MSEHDVFRALEAVFAWFKRRSSGFRERCDQRVWKNVEDVLHKNYSLVASMIDGIPVKNCVGCGHCCLKARCAYSWEAEGKEYKDPLEAMCHEGDKAKAICPWLFWDGDRWRCKIAQKYKRQLGIGEGCCQGLNSFRTSIAKAGPRNIWNSGHRERYPS